jgi:hypothetical protein
VSRKASAAPDSRKRTVLPAQELLIHGRRPVLEVPIVGQEGRATGDGEIRAAIGVRLYDRIDLVGGDVAGVFAEVVEHVVGREVGRSRRAADASLTSAPCRPVIERRSCCASSTMTWIEGAPRW